MHAAGVSGKVNDSDHCEMTGLEECSGTDLLLGHAISSGFALDHQSTVK